MKQKQQKILTIGGLILVLLYLLVNLPFILASFKVKPILSKIGFTYVSERDKAFAGNYIRNISEIRVRGCTTGAKIIFLECNMGAQEWALGKEKSIELNQYLKISEPKPKLFKNKIDNNIPSEEDLIKFNNEFDIGG